MAQPVNAGGGTKPRTSSRVSNALKTGVVYGGSAVLTAVNNITPHIAGAVDILVIEQPDGTRKATPFYVRFGKYTALRTRERNVKLYVNDELALFGMHIGMYGQAYFATETVEVTTGEDDEGQEALLAGMMSPPSGYSSGVDEPSLELPDSAAEAGTTLSAVRQRIDGMKDARRSSGRSVAGPSSGARGNRMPLLALGTGEGASGGSPPSMGEAADAVPEAATIPGSASAAVVSEGRRREGQESKVQLAPAMSMADRNESFMSARETLTMQLTDELVSSALTPISPSLLTSPDLKSQLSRVAMQSGHAYPCTGAIWASTNSLGAVSEGASPCVWSEDEDEQAQAEKRSIWSNRQGPRQLEVEAGPNSSTPGGDGVCTPDVTTMQALPELQQQPTTTVPNETPHPHHHYTSVHHPFYQQVGFPENSPSDVSAVSPAELSDTVAVASTALDRMSPDQVPVEHLGAAAAVASSVPSASCATGFSVGTTSCSGFGSEGGSRLQGRVDSGHVLGAACLDGSSGTKSVTPMALSGASAMATVPVLLPRPQPAAASASPSAGPGELSTAAAEGCSQGSAPGSHSAISLLSSSLRGSAWEGRSGSQPSRIGSRPSLDCLRAQGNRGLDHSPQMQPGFLQLSADGAMTTTTSASVDVAVGPIAASAAASAATTRPRSALEPSLEERNVRLSLTVLLSGKVRASVCVFECLHQPVQAPALTRASGRPGPHREGIIGEETASSEVVNGILTTASESGYLGDVEGALTATATPVPLAHHGCHHHNQHYHHHHHLGHGHSQHDRGDLHSTSAPLPSRTTLVATGAGAASAVNESDPGDIAMSVGAAPCMSPAVHGIELSLCSSHLTPSMSYTEACTLFNAHRLSEEDFFIRAQQLSTAPDLVIRLSNGVMYPCHQLSYSLLGLLAFGTWRLPPLTPCWAPDSASAVGSCEAAASAAAAAAAAAMIAATQCAGAGTRLDTGKNDADGAGVSGTISSSAATTPKKGQPNVGSWRLWMFGSRREGTTRTLTAGGAGGGGVSSSLGGRSPQLTSPISEYPGTVEQRSVGVDMETRSSPPVPAAEAVLSASMPLTHSSPAEGSSTPAGAVETLSGGLAPAGGSSGGAVASAFQSKSDQRQGYSVVTKKSLTPSAEQLAALPLKHGQNTITYKVGASELRAYVYFLPWRTRIVISDIDGTITRSDVLGHLLPAMGLDWSHPGIAELLTNIRQNNYLVMYLSSRAISQANITRDFINTLVQGEHRMPLGPVIISPHGLLPSLYREMILRRPHEFKIATLQDIRALFPPDWNPFYGGFGNRDTDEISYREVGVQPSRIFIINPRGELRQPVDTSNPYECVSAGSPSGAAPAVVAPVVDVKSHNQEGVSVGTAGIDGSEQQQLDALLAQASGATVTGTRVAPRRSVSGPATVARRSNGVVSTTTAIAFSTLFAINELVHHIFPPLRDDHLVMPEGAESGGSANASDCSDAKDTLVRSVLSAVETVEARRQSRAEGTSAGEDVACGSRATYEVEVEVEVESQVSETAGCSRCTATVVADESVMHEVSSSLEDGLRLDATGPDVSPQSPVSHPRMVSPSNCSAALEPQSSTIVARAADAADAAPTFLEQAAAGSMYMSAAGAVALAVGRLEGETAAATGQGQPAEGSDVSTLCGLCVAQQAVSSNSRCATGNSADSTTLGAVAVDELVSTAVTLHA